MQIKNQILEKEKSALFIKGSCYKGHCLVAINKNLIPFHTGYIPSSGTNCPALYFPKINKTFIFEIAFHDAESYTAYHTVKGKDPQFVDQKRPDNWFWGWFRYTSIPENKLLQSYTIIA